jgi:hypothetical protein
MDGDNSRILVGIFIDYRRATVGRAVVDEDNLNILERLRNN